MSIIGSNLLAGASGQGGAYEIERSLRFNSADSPYLSRTPPSSGTGEGKTWTWSGWIKRGKSTPSNLQLILSASSSRSGFGFFTYSGGGTGSDTFSIYHNASFIQRVETTQVFRDFSSWYHVVVSVDTTQATAADRIRIYVNGAEVTDFSTATYPAQNYQFGICQATAHAIGRDALASAYYYDGYLAETYLIDGSALDHTSFGETDTETGAWIPKQYSGSYGTNGFYLNFSDNSSVSALGTDSSGNGNDWTPNNFSVTAGAGNDSLEDTPTNNWCTLNPLDVTSGTFSNGNLNWALNAGRASRGTFFNSTGKWYFEATLTAGTNPGYFVPGIQRNSGSLGYYGGTNNIPDGYGYQGFNGTKLNDTTQASYGNTFTTNDVIGVAFDLDAGKVWFSKNGTWQASGDPAAGTNPAFSSIVAGAYAPYVSNQTTSNNDHTGVINCGQRPFAYTPPTGYKALNTANLPEPTIKDGTKHFDTLLETGTGSSRSISSLSFQPDFLWAKGRNASSSHLLYDSVRGVDKSLNTNTTLAEDTTAGQLTSFDLNGYTLPNDTAGYLNYSGRTYAFWNWKAGGSSSSNTDGTITSTVSANVDAGFSIVSYAGNSTLGATVGHGLGVAPKMIITKTTNTALGNWGVYHEGMADSQNAAHYMVNLNLPNVRTDSYLWWNDTVPTSTVFTLGTSNDVNGSSNYIAYCFAEVEGYSKFGSYTGNGSSDGPFVYCGFRPAFILTKVDNSAYNWTMYDSARSPYNASTYVLFPNLSNTESQSTDHFDWLSNGFKLRDTSINPSGTNVIFMAFAETPFKYANAR
jgi:hypothetical protein